MSRKQANSIALLKIVRFHDDESTTRAVPNFIQPTLADPTGCQGRSTIIASRYPNDFFLLPTNTRFNFNTSTPALAGPWFMAIPVKSGEEGLQALAGLDDSSVRYPLDGRSSDFVAKLQIEHATVTIGRAPNQRPVSRFVTFNRRAGSITSSLGINQ